MINIISFPNTGLSFTVNRVAFSIFGKPVYWYAIFIVLAMVIGTVYVLKALPKEGIKEDDIMNMILIAIPAAIICARIYYVIFSFSDYKNNPAGIFAIWNGGLAIYGGVIGATLSLLIYCKIKKLPYFKISDYAALTILLGQAIGRWGNFVNGEAFGGVTNSYLAMTIETGGKIIVQNVHPTFLYESLWNFAGFIFLMLYKKHKKFDGEIFLLYIAWYGLGRGFIEGLRADSLMLGAARISQWLAFISAAAAFIILIIIRERKKPHN